jgi:hypothetical protein
MNRDDARALVVVAAWAAALSVGFALAVQAIIGVL